MATHSILLGLGSPVPQVVSGEHHKQNGRGGPMSKSDRDNTKKNRPNDHEAWHDYKIVD